MSNEGHIILALVLVTVVLFIGRFVDCRQDSRIEAIEKHLELNQATNYCPNCKGEI